MTPTNGFLRFLGHLITLPPAEAKRRENGMGLASEGRCLQRSEMTSLGMSVSINAYIYIYVIIRVWMCARRVKPELATSASKDQQEYPTI